LPKYIGQAGYSNAGGFLDPGGIKRGRDTLDLVGDCGPASLLSLPRRLVLIEQIGIHLLFQL